MLQSKHTMSSIHPSACYYPSGMKVTYSRHDNIYRVIYNEYIKHPSNNQITAKDYDEKEGFKKAHKAQFCKIVFYCIHKHLENL